MNGVYNNGFLKDLLRDISCQSRFWSFLAIKCGYKAAALPPADSWFFRSVKLTDLHKYLREGTVDAAIVRHMSICFPRGMIDMHSLAELHAHCPQESARREECPITYADIVHKCVTTCCGNAFELSALGYNSLTQHRCPMCRSSTFGVYFALDH